METNNINLNRSMNSQQPQQVPQMNMQQSYGRPSRLPWVILAIVVIVLVVLGVLFRDKLGMGAKKDSNVSDYEAVFLTNGQVYFGKLTGRSDAYITLKDIYYLQVNQALQSGGTQTQANQQPELSLVKLGNELHGPVDEMKINRDQVLFYEQLKNDGKVVQAIKEYQKNPNGTTTAPQSQTPAQTTPTTPTK